MKMQRGALGPGSTISQNVGAARLWAWGLASELLHQMANFTNGPRWETSSGGAHPACMGSALCFPAGSERWLTAAGAGLARGPKIWETSWQCQCSVRDSKLVLATWALEGFQEGETFSQPCLIGGLHLFPPKYWIFLTFKRTVSLSRLKRGKLNAPRGSLQRRGGHRCSPVPMLSFFPSRARAQAQHRHESQNG